MTHRDQLPSNRPRERGAVLAYVAVALIGLMAFSALVIDMGVLWVGRRQAQNAADAGALSGAISLVFVEPPSDPDNLADPAYTRAKNAAATVAKANRAWGLEPRVDPATDVRIIDCPDPIPNLPDKCVQVSAYRNQEGGTGNVPLPTFFARLVGVEEQGARATATAQIVPGVAVSCPKPWAIPDLWGDVVDTTVPIDALITTPGDTFDYYDGNGAHAPLLNPRDYYVRPGSPSSTGYTAQATMGQLMVLKSGTPADAIAPGWFYPIDLERTGEPDPGGARYRDNIRNCPPNVEAIGDTLVVEPGNMIGPTAQGIRDLLAKDPTAEFDPTAPAGTCRVRYSSCSSLGTCIDGTRSPRWVPLPVFNPETWATARNAGRYELEIVEIIGVFIEGLGQDLTTTERNTLIARGYDPDNNDVIARFCMIPATGADRDGTSTFMRTIQLVR